MTDKVVVLVSAASRAEARKISKRLIDLRLAACVNVTEPVQSIYRWQGKIEEAREFLLVIKTTRDLFKKVQAEVLKNHSNTTPEIICLPIIDGSRDYLMWLSESVKQTGPAK